MDTYDVLNPNSNNTSIEKLGVSNMAGEANHIASEEIKIIQL